MDKLFFLIGALSGALAVGLGAFGAHALRARLTPELLATFETGVRYQMYHVFAILIVALALTRGSSTWLALAGWAFLLGTILFSGSLYLLALTGIRLLGVITPLGGIALIAGWLLLALGAWQSQYSTIHY